MSKFAALSTLLVAVLACGLLAAPAQAVQRARTFVASYGSDSNPCTFGSPCKTFQHAVDVVAAGGEVTAIDSAGFGPISISHAVTITSPAGIEAGIVAVAGGDAIDINAGSTDAIILRGLTLNGSGVGYNGVVFTSGASLTVSDCVVENFAYSASDHTGNGILIVPSTNDIFYFDINNSVVANNQNIGIYYHPPSGVPLMYGTINHVTANSNIWSAMTFDTTLAGASVTYVTVSNSVASNTGRDGIYADLNSAAGATMTVMVDNVAISNGGDSGILAYHTVHVLLSHSAISGNLYGIGNSTSPNTFYSYGDNRINGNGTDIGVGGGFTAMTSAPTK
jgi:hypothetical protein